MADRYPIIYNPSANQLQELASGDNLDLSGNNIINLAGIAVTNINVVGVVTASRFVSGVATGTAPLTVSSTTKVTNLNADLLDDLNTSSTDTTGNSVVTRSSGNFSAGIITATTFSGNLTGNVTGNVAGNINSSGVSTATTLSGTTVTYTTGNFTTGNIVTGIVTTIRGTNLNYSGIGTITTFNATSSSVTNYTGTNLNLTGVGTITSLNIGTVAGISTTITTVATTSATTIDSFSATVFRSARVQVQITQSTNYQASDVLVIHDGSAASIVEYGSIATNDYLGSLTATVSGGNCLLQVTMGSATSATVKVLSQRVTV